ncbi:MAG TPA: hypothetical protein VFZ80_08495, partial [Acidimicrobiia bacterium]
MEIGPSYDGSGLVNLVSELESRMTGTSTFPRLVDASAIPEAATYVLVLFDGLGVTQLDHADAGVFRSAL